VFVIGVGLTVLGQAEFEHLQVVGSSGGSGGVEDKVFSSRRLQWRGGGNIACGLREVAAMDVDTIVCYDNCRVAVAVMAGACFGAVAWVAASASAAAAVRRKVVSIVDVEGAIAAARQCNGRGGGE
jgi:hypothetical protein